MSEDTRAPAGKVEDGALLVAAALIGAKLAPYVEGFAPGLGEFVLPALMIGVSLLASVVRDYLGGTFGAQLYQLLFKNLAPIALLVIVPASMLVTGCLTFDKAGYLAAASTEISAVDEAACKAHSDAYTALSAGEGDSKASYGPLGSANAIKEQGNAHGRQEASCTQLLGREDLTPAFADRTTAAWRALFDEGLLILEVN